MGKNVDENFLAHTKITKIPKVCPDLGVLETYGQKYICLPNMLHDPQACS